MWCCYWLAPSIQQVATAGNSFINYVLYHCIHEIEIYSQDHNTDVMYNIMITTC